MKREIRFNVFYLIIISLCWIFCSDTFASDISYRPELKKGMFSSELNPYQYVLEKAGYDINDLNDVKRAALLDGEPIRECAIWFLAIKTDTESIPILKQALDDVNPSIHCLAARLLGFLGDKSGLEQMKKDMEELKQGGYDRISKESIANRPKGPITLGYKVLRLGAALNAAKVLAEFGDTSGFKLAAENAIESKFPDHKRTAIKTLTELARFDKDTLEAKGAFPEKVLLDVLEKESDSMMINSMIVDAQSFMNPETANKILEKISQSERFSSELRQKADQGINALKKRVERENKLKGNEVIRQ
jgi:hypothetical protein